MGVFRTEKEIEAWLETETREFPLPDGTRRKLGTMRLMWAVYDDILKAGGYTPEMIARWTAQEMSLQNLSLQDAFHCVIAYVDKHIQKRGK